MIVPATEPILRRFWGGSIPHTMTAFVALHDEDPVAVAGFYFDRDRLVAFVEGFDRLSMREKVQLKWAWSRALRGTPLPIQASADPEIAGAETLLRHLGFRELGQGVWTWRT